MRTTLVIDDEQLRQVESYRGPVKNLTGLVREGLTALIQREAALRLSRMGGIAPDLKPIPRRRSPL